MSTTTRLICTECGEGNLEQYGAWSSVEHIVDPWTEGP